MARQALDETAKYKSHRRPSLEVALTILSAVFAFCFSFKFPLYPIFAESDHLIFVYEGWRMFNGELIYRDFFEFTFPGSQLFYSLMFALFGVKYWAAAAAVVMIAAASCWVLLRVSGQVIPNAFYLLPAVVFIFFGFRWFGIDASHRMFSPIFMMAAVLVILGGTAPLRLVSAGLLCALTSFFTQQRGAVAVAGIAVFLIIESRALGTPFVTAIRMLGTLAAAFFGALAAMVLPFAIAAGPELFFQSTVVYPALYYKYGAPNHFGIYLVDLGKAFANTSATGLFAILPTLFYAIVLPIGVVSATVWLVICRRGSEWSRLRAPALIAIVSLLCLLSTTAPNQFRLFQISMPFLVLVSWHLGELIDSVKLRQRVVVAVAAFSILIAVLQAARFQTNWDFIYWNTPTGTLALMPSAQSERYLWLTEHTAPGDLFFEVYEPFIYFPLQLKNPTRFGQIWPSEYTRPEHIAEVTADLKRRPPRFILWDNSYNFPAHPRPPGDNTEPLSAFVLANYAPVGKIYMIGDQPIQIWEHRTAGGPPLQ